MVPEPRFRRDLFRGTAEYYERFRPAYPPALFDDLRARAPLGADARVLDLACGTGQIAFDLAHYVAEVWAIDQEAEFVELGWRKAQRVGLTNIRWSAARAERVDLDGAFDLATIGNAFHRLDRETVARRLVPHLAPRGCVALVWSDPPSHGEQPWQHVLNDTLGRWQDRLGARDRVPADWEEVIDRDPHAAVLRRAGLAYEGRFEFTTTLRWSVESLIGFVASTSFLNRTVVGDSQHAFEADVRRQLLASCPDGVFEQEQTSAYELARRAS